MDKSSKSMLIIVFLFLALVIGGSAFGISYIVKLLERNYPEQDISGIIEQTSAHEGYCLTDIVQENNLTMNNIAEFYKDACVSIIAEGSSGAWLGSGVCIASQGYEFASGEVIENGSYIVTNHHVFEDAEEDPQFNLFVYPNEYDDVSRYGKNVEYEAEVLWSDAYLDMAIIYVKENIDWVRCKDRVIECEENEFLTISDSVFVIGTPQYIAYQNTITKGKIASNDVSVSYTVSQTSYGSYILDNVYEYLIPMKVPIMGGNSGGGLFDSNGYLIGQPTLGVENSQSIYAVNYSIPIYPATLILDYIIELNEDEANPEIKLYGLDDIDCILIDQIEWEVVRDCFNGISKYFYGTYYIEDQLKHSKERDLKIVASENTNLVEGDYISAVKVGNITTELYCRNDLIFALLSARSGETITFSISGKGDVELLLA